MIRQRAGARAFGSALFVLSSLAVGLTAFVVLAVLAHVGAPGELAAASAVISVSFVLAVVPGAIQLRTSAQVAAGELPTMPRRFVGGAGLGLLAGAWPLGALLAVSPTALALLALQFGAASLASAQRGLAIGAADRRHATESMAVEAGVRLIAGIPLGLAFGATGLAAALLLGSLAAALAGCRWAGTTQPGTGREVLAPALAVGLLMLLVNFDAFVAPRLLGTAPADLYAVAELPARGVFFALFAFSWLAVPTAIRAAGPRALLTPVGGVLAVGAALGLSLLLVRPLLPIALGDPAPDAALLATLTAAMTLAAALATALAMAVARGADGAWLPTMLATGALAVAALTSSSATPQLLASAVLACTAAALAATLALLLRTASRPARTPAGSALLVGR